jgi:glycosyltransferase involved in cell wall biosynthesis
MSEIDSLVYICTGWIPSRQANGLQTINMCSAFAKLGLRLTLYYIPSPHFKDDPLDYYHVKTPLTLKPLVRAVLPMRKSFTLEKWSSLPSFAHAFIWSGFVAHRAAQSKADLYFVRDAMLAWWLGRRGLPTVLEIHELKGREQIFIRKAAQYDSVKLVVAVTEHLRADLAKQFEIPFEKTLALHDGVELDGTRCSTTKKEARQQLGLPLDKPLVVYTGQLSAEKGVDVLVRAAPLLKGIHVFIVGHEPDWLRQLLRGSQARNVTFVGFRSHSDALLFQRAADVLVLPHSMKYVHSAYYTSPLKLFEYMAAGVPIVASDLPSNREVIRHGQNGWLVEPDNPGALAQAIHRLLEDRDEAEELAKQATHDVQRYTWERRAGEILMRSSH